MTINQAVQQLLDIEALRAENAYSENSIAVGMARIGTDSQKIVCGTMLELLHVDFGAPLHSLVITGKMHFLERDALSEFAINLETFDKFVVIG